MSGARRLGVALLLAGGCAALSQAAFGGEAGASNPAGTESSLRLAQISRTGEATQGAAPHADSAQKKFSSSKRAKKSIRQPKTSVAAPYVVSEAKMREFMQLTSAQLEQRIVEQRQILRLDPKDEAARQILGLIAVELGNRILDLDALGRRQDIARLMDVIRKDLHDTLWRVSQMAKADGRAAASLALFYSEGILAQREPGTACELYARAAQAGHLAAAYQAGLCKTRTDPKLAKTLLERAAENGHAGAEELMGRACIEDEAKDIACALDWLQRAAVRGRPSAMSLLGWLYSSDSAHMDLGKSVHYYRAAADAGDAAAQNNLGEFFETGRGVAQDTASAFSWYARAAAAGFPPAQLNLARLYAAGTGVARDLATARLWAERARSQGQDQAQVLLDWLATKN